MDLSKYENCCADIYKIDQLDLNMGYILPVSANMLNKLSLLKKVKCTVYKHKLKELHKIGEKYAAFIRIPIDSFIEDGHLFNIYKKRGLTVDTFPILGNYDEVDESVIYYSNGCEYSVIGEKKLLRMTVYNINNYDLQKMCKMCDL